MKQILFAAALLLSAAFPASADVRFIGAVNVTSVANCAFTGVGDKFASRYRPPAVAGNPTSGGLTMMSVGRGYAIEFPGAHPALNVNQTVSSVETGAFGFDVYNTVIRFSARTAVTTATRFVTLRGFINEPLGEKFSPGACVVGFEAALVRE
jgi:hypothetical protein